LALADIVVVNKADREGAAECIAVAKERVGSISVGGADWLVPVLSCRAYRSEGISDLLEILEQHEQFLRRGSGFEERSRMTIRMQLAYLLRMTILSRLGREEWLHDELSDAAQGVAAGRVDLATAAGELADRLLGGAGA
jgi:LAO/AO transport system kinase